MIVEYHRPKTIEAALQLLARQKLKTVPLGGGTVLSRQAAENLAVVDLQELPLKMIEEQDDQLMIGATATLQALVASPLLPDALQQAAALEANVNLRQVATLAGALVSGDGRSPLATVLAAMDAVLTWHPGNISNFLSEWLLARPKAPGRLITQMGLPLDVTVKAEFVGRTPVDVPWVGAAVCRWRCGRIRAAVCGFGSAPLVVWDGSAITDIESEVNTACSQYHATKNFTYKLYTAKKLIHRLANN